MAFISQKGERAYPSSQELFYEWQADVSTGKSITNLRIEIAHATEDDAVVLSPASAVSSDLVPGWLSGFGDPNRTIPDFYRRTFTFPSVAPGDRVARIFIRRKLIDPAIPDDAVISLTRAWSDNCEITAPNTNSSEDLSNSAKLLFEGVYESSPDKVPIKEPPGGPAPGQLIAFLWARCADDKCKRLLSSSMEAALGKNPGETAHDRLQELAKDVEEILGCVKGPMKEMHPSGTWETLSACDDQALPTPDQTQRLLSAMERVGAKVDLHIVDKGDSEPIDPTPPSR